MNIVALKETAAGERRVGLTPQVVDKLVRLGMSVTLETGIGDLSDTQVAAAIRGGRGRHGAGQLAVMPWQGYARLTDQDLEAIVAYLRSIEAVSHKVPDRVAPGAVARAPFVYFGVYRRR
ncbi:MAG: hypothetical protein P8Y02_13020 [Deinococcales bacterium]